MSSTEASRRHEDRVRGSQIARMIQTQSCCSRGMMLSKSSRGVGEAKDDRFAGSLQLSCMPLPATVLRS